MTRDLHSFSLDELRVIFGYKDSASVGKKLRESGVVALTTPTGRARSTTRYSMRDAAPVLCRLSERQIERKMSLMTNNQLPPVFRKEYWAGEASRLKVEQMKGNLWPTEEVELYVGAAFKALRMNLILIPDAVAREQTLAEEHRILITRLLNAALADIKVRLVEQFKELVIERQSLKIQRERRARQEADNEYDGEEGDEFSGRSGDRRSDEDIEDIEGNSDL